MYIFFIGHIVLDTIQKKSKNIESIGGTVVYGSVTASRLGFKNSIISYVGKDFPEHYFSFLTSNNVGIDYIKIAKKYSTTRFKLIYDKNGQRKLVLLSKCKNITIEDIILKNGIYFVVPVIGEVSLDILKKIYKYSSFVVTDIQGFIRKTDRDGIIYLDADEEINKIFKYTHILHAEFNEAKIITGENSLKGILRTLKQNTLNITLLTLGERGSYVIHNKKIFFIPSIPVKNVIDPTGTGDVYTTTFAIDYFKNKDVFKASSLSTAAASYLVEDVGIKGIRTLRDYQKRAVLVLPKIKEIHI